MASTGLLPERLRRIRRTLLIILFADLTALAARVSLPIPPVPLTMQTVMVLLSGAFLGSRGGLAAMLLYLVMGLVGLPVFVAGGGPAYVLAPTFGYLAGFAAGAWLTGFILEQRVSRRWREVIPAMAAGLTAIYIPGVIGLWLNLRYLQDKPVPLAGVVKAGVLLPLPGDLLKLLVAASLARALAPLAERLAGKGDRDYHR